MLPSHVPFTRLSSGRGIPIPKFHQYHPGHKQSITKTQVLQD
jgi:hypothetical protein